MFVYFKRFWKENLGVFFLLFLGGTAQTIAGMRFSAAFDGLTERDMQAFSAAILQIFLLFLLFLFLTYFTIIARSKTQQKMSTAIRTDTVSRLEKTSYTNFHEKQVGTYASWLSNDITTIEQQGFSSSYEVLSNVIQTVTSIIALLYYHWSIVLMTLAICALTLALPKIYQKQMGEASLQTTKESERFLSRITDVLSGFDTLFSLNLLNLLSRRTKEASLELAETKNSQAAVIAKVAVLGALGNVLGQVSIMGLTGYLALRSILTIGAIAATANLASTVFNTVGNLSHQIAGIQSIEPIFEKLKEIPQVASHEESTPLATSGISLNGLCYSYSGKKALRELSHEFEIGKKYAITGSSGSGKSTLLNILNGKLTDYEGSVLFGGKELKEFSGKELRDQILYIDQLPYLFNGTIRENITMGEAFSEEAIRRVLKEAALEEVIEALPDGLDTPVGEAGRSLSGGQRQRVALARGLIRGKKSS